MGFTLRANLSLGDATSALAISGTPITIGEQNVVYAGFTVTATGGQTPYTYSVHAGTLPTGITLNASTGAVAGTPTVAGTQAGIVIRATDNGGETADLPAFQIAVANAVQISGTPITTATQNVAYAGFTVSGSAGVAPYAYSVTSGTLPTGITLNASTGAVSGTPTVVQTQAGIVISVTDARGGTASLAPFQIAVTAPNFQRLAAAFPFAQYVNQTSLTSTAVVPGAYVDGR